MAFNLCNELQIWLLEKIMILLPVKLFRGDCAKKFKKSWKMSFLIGKKEKKCSKTTDNVTK